MRRPRPCLALLAAFPLAVVARAAEDPALAVVEACRARLDPGADVGLARIEKRCPKLLPALRDAPWSKLLPPDMRERRDEVSAESLRELVVLVRQVNRELAAASGDDPSPTPDVADLAPVLAGLGEQGQQGATRWERFKRWIKDKLDRRDREDEQDSWLENLGRKFQTSEGVSELIALFGRICVGLLLLVVIVSELRAAGLLGGTRGDAAKRQKAGEWRRRLQLTDVLAAPLADRPGMLLQLLGEALTRAHRLPSAAGLTAAALVRQAKLDSEQQRAELEQVARTAEAVRYAPRPPDSAALEGAVSAARSLLDKLARQAGVFRRESR